MNMSSEDYSPLSNDGLLDSSAGASPINDDIASISLHKVNNHSSNLIPKQKSKTQIYSMLHLSCSFCFLFMAFSVAQSFQTSSEHPSEGSNALGILYACFTATNFISSYIISALGVKYSLFFGSWTYVAFVAANIRYNVYLLYIFSASLGCGASVLWTAQGSYTTNLANIYEYSNDLPASSTMGLFNGIFWSIFQMNQCLGNLLVALLFNFDISQWLIFTVMTCIGGIGSLSLFFVRIPNKQKVIQEKMSSNYNYAPGPGNTDNILGDGANIRKQPVTLKTLFVSLRLLLDARMILLIPIIIYSGISQSYIFGEYPALITDKSLKYFCLAVFGAVDSLSSVISGKLSDIIGKLPIILIGTIAHFVCYIFFLLWTVDQDAKGYFFLFGIGLAIGDGVFNTQISAILGTYFEGPRSSDAFANNKLFQAGSTAIAFLYHDHIGFNAKTYIVIGSLALGVIPIIILRQMFGLEKSKNKRLDNNDNLPQNNSSINNHMESGGAIHTL